MIDFESLVRTLADNDVEFVLVGGLAAILHGSARVTYDLDVVYRRTDENIARLVQALSDCAPYLRGAPPGLPFRWDEATLRRGLNFTLTTTLGDVDLLGEITGGGGYDELIEHAIVMTVYGFDCRVLGLEMLIHVKRAAGRPKDFEALAELEAIRIERNRRGDRDPE